LRDQSGTDQVITVAPAVIWDYQRFRAAVLARTGMEFKQPMIEAVPEGQRQKAWEKKLGILWVLWLRSKPPPEAN
jgi:hypothetical protein